MPQTANTPAPHELLELHELIRTEIIGVKKLETSLPLVEDQELRTFMEQSLTMKKNTLHQCEQFCFKMEHQRLQ